MGTDSFYSKLVWEQPKLSVHHSNNFNCIFTYDDHIQLVALGMMADDMLKKEKSTCTSLTQNKM